jgi:hypothetical protein
LVKCKTTRARGEQTAAAGHRLVSVIGWPSCSDRVSRAAAYTNLIKVCIPDPKQNRCIPGSEFIPISDSTMMGKIRNFRVWITTING